ncbi:phosphinothricin acetyltransferase [Maribacter vaceletii]|uniref:Phosphinothricin acetyltransferase n=1 Tax=Maribacter vaceletii TaxID=1206816 RepID=A0A495EC44_9FLAO|nr:GNAT family N-acetyltransferase [Maribacter vaceletii]RKR14445.1 phosphinothricin acetyltransferase [Maribacter vaceletii]
MEIHKMVKDNWGAVAKIYKEGIDTHMATFETKVPKYQDWDTSHLQIGRLVMVKEDKVLGWAALSPVSSRCVYGGVAEVSVYIGKEHRGLGIGKLLMRQLILESEIAKIWTLQSGIFPDNIGSITLHKKMGFRYIGKRERIGKLKGVWKDNVLFERRSKIIGIE